MIKDKQIQKEKIIFKPNNEKEIKEYEDERNKETQNITKEEINEIDKKGRNFMGNN